MYSFDPEVQDIARNVDWYIIPMANPDGYAYTWDDNRNWRKTRSKVSSICNGVDPNRNFAFSWLKKAEDGDEGASRAPCSDTYAGPYAFSESETIAMENFVMKNKEKFDVYLSFHSYAHQILFPFGHTLNRIVSKKPSERKIVQFFYFRRKILMKIKRLGRRRRKN